MSEFSRKLQQWIDDYSVDAELLHFEQSVYSVEEAVAASGHPVERFTKSIAMMDDSDRVIIAVVPADCRASTERVRKALQLDSRPRTATAEESEQRLGQQVGGNSPLNARQATVLIDPLVLQKDWLLTGGGDSRTLTKIATAELARVIDFTEVRVRK
ncbi:MAG: aminoacyl-tRNA deacylase [Pseudomonadales bacterium]